MKQKKTQNQAREDRRTEFHERLIDKVWIELPQDGEYLLIRSNENHEMFCEITFRELLNQDEFRHKVLIVSSLILPLMEQAEYLEYVQVIMDHAEIVQNLMSLELPEMLTRHERQSPIRPSSRAYKPLDRMERGERHALPQFHSVRSLPQTLNR